MNEYMVFFGCCTPIIVEAENMDGVAAMYPQAIEIVQLPNKEEA